MTPYASAADLDTGAASISLADQVVSEPVELSSWTTSVKRTVDVVGSAALLIILSPMLLLIAALVKLTSPGPMLFGHTRIGRDGEQFRCWKFRTMCEDAEERLRDVLDCPERRAEFAENHKLKDDPRVTPIGGFLRASSLDELPQLVNVLLGHMSLVGPRPVVAEELPRYGRLRAHYLSVRPGVTGPWQTSGRSDTTFEERVLLDRDYVDGLSFWGDVRYLLLTVKVVVLRLGAY